ncbi:MAG: HAMP domain-containing protein [Candidatus Rokubacteria bacterium]|nr:HAMP domain-containing protein [Candidatus Rokubacteria bacterium]
MRFTLSPRAGRLSIRAKLVVAFVLFAGLPVVAVGSAGALHAFALLNGGLEDRLRTETTLKAETIRRAMSQAEADALFLGALPTARALAAHAHPRSAAAVAEAFLGFARSRPVYDQVRFLDREGRELVRIGRGASGPVVAPARRLQSKRDRYYFAEAMATPVGRVYVSPMDLNIEHGAVERPLKPVVRFAVAVAHHDGTPRGMVVLNLLAAQVLEEALGASTGTLTLASSKGYYLARAEADASPDRRGMHLAFPQWLTSWATRSEFVRLAPATERVTAEYPPDVAARILSGVAGTLAEPGLRGRIIGFAPIRPGTQDEFWVLVHARDKAEALASIRSLQLVVAGLGGLAVAVALGAGLLAARHFTRPITHLAEGAQAIARGDFDRFIHVDTGDELEDLGHHFRRMAGELKAHDRRLHEAHARVERRARYMRALYDVATDVLAQHAQRDILARVVDAARTLLGADAAALTLCAEGGNQLAASSGISTDDGGTQVAVPLRGAGGELGSLCVRYRDGHAMLADEREFLTALADQAALAVEKARLQERVRTLAALEECERIAADLHDGIMQSLYATGLGLDACIALVAEDPSEAATRLRELGEQIDTVIRDVRNYVVGLSPESLKGKTLGDALTELAHDVALNRLATVAVAVDPGASGALSGDATREVYMIGREAIANVARHAPGARVAIRLERGVGGLCLSVEDDGHGFDAATTRSGCGLRNIEERARRLGGEARVESAPGQGTRITVNVPVGT